MKTLIFKKWIKIAAIITVVAFTVNTVLQDYAFAARPKIDSSKFNEILNSSDDIKRTFSIDSFYLPEYLGEIKTSYRARGTSHGSRATVLHIQDAHCNYGAQHKITEIIEYLNNVYGITDINLEGGEGAYDLSLFTKIEDKNIREKVSDSFVKEGEINGAEFYAIMNPGKVNLWGVEDPDLYIKNLDVYQETAKDKEIFDRLLKELTHHLNRIKLQIFSKELISFDSKHRAFENNDVGLKEYVQVIINVVDSYDMDMDVYPNIILLKKAIGLEQGINFDKANTEREALIDILQRDLSKAELEELVTKVVQFKFKRLSPEKVYSYLAFKARCIGIDINNFPNLGKFQSYISQYETVDKSKLFEEIETLEEKLADNLAETQEQKTLLHLSKTLSLIKSMLGIQLTKKQYEYYLDHKTDLDAQNFINFISASKKSLGGTFNLRKGGTCNLESANGTNLLDLNKYIERIEKFYEYSFERDEAFLKNITTVPNRVWNSWKNRSKPGLEQLERVTVLVTGGFHSENLFRLMREKGISYISITPEFENPSGYESPYFSVLNGELSGDYIGAKQALAVSMIAIASGNTKLGKKVRAVEVDVIPVIAAMLLARETGKKGIVIYDECFDLNWSLIEGDISSEDKFEIVCLPEHPDMLVNGLQTLISKTGLSEWSEITRYIIDNLPDIKKYNELRSLLRHTKKDIIAGAWESGGGVDVVKIKRFKENQLSEEALVILELAWVLSSLQGDGSDTPLALDKSREDTEDTEEELPVMLFGGGLSIDEDPQKGMPTFMEFARKYLEIQWATLKTFESEEDKKTLESVLKDEQHVISPSLLFSVLFRNFGDNFLKAYEVFNEDSYKIQNPVLTAKLVGEIKKKFPRKSWLIDILKRCGVIALVTRLYLSKKKTNKSQELVANIVKKTMNKSPQMRKIITINVDSMLERALYEKNIVFKTYAEDNDFAVYQLGEDIRAKLAKEQIDEIRDITEVNIDIDKTSDRIKIFKSDNMVNIRLPDTRTKVIAAKKGNTKHDEEVKQNVKLEMLFSGIRLFKLNGTVGFAPTNDVSRGIDEALRWEDEGLSPVKERFFIDLLGKSKLLFLGYSGRDRKLFSFLLKNQEFVKHKSEFVIHKRADGTFSDNSRNIERRIHDAYSGSYEGKLFTSHGDVYGRLNEMRQKMGISKSDIPIFPIKLIITLFSSFFIPKAFEFVGWFILEIFVKYNEGIQVLSGAISKIDWVAFLAEGLSNMMILMPIGEWNTRVLGFWGLTGFISVLVILWIFLVPKIKKFLMKGKIIARDEMEKVMLRDSMKDITDSEKQNAQAELLGHYGEWQEALVEFQKILNELNKTSLVNKTFLVKVYYNLGMAQYKVGFWDDAIVNLKRSVVENPVLKDNGDISEDIDESDFNAIYTAYQTYISLGYIYGYEMGKNEEAEEYYGKADRALKEVEKRDLNRDMFEIIRNKNNEGLQKIDIKELGKAEELFKYAKEEAEKLGFGNEMRRANKYLGLVYRKRGEWKEALKCYKESIKRACEYSGIKNTFFNRNNEGFLETDDKRGKAVISAINVDRVKEVAGLAKTLRAVGLFYLERGIFYGKSGKENQAKRDFDIAEEYIKESNGIWKTIQRKRQDNRIWGREAKQNMGENYVYFGRIYFEKNDFKGAEKKIKKAIGECFAYDLEEVKNAKDKSKARSLKGMVDAQLLLVRWYGAQGNSERDKKKMKDHLVEAREHAGRLQGMTGDERSLREVQAAEKEFLANIWTQDPQGYSTTRHITSDSFSLPVDSSGSTAKIMGIFLVVGLMCLLYLIFPAIPEAAVLEQAIKLAGAGGELAGRGIGWDKIFRWIMYFAGIAGSVGVVFGMSKIEDGKVADTEVSIEKMQAALDSNKKEEAIKMCQKLLPSHEEDINFYQKILESQANKETLKAVITPLLAESGKKVIGALCQAYSIGFSENTEIKAIFQEIYQNAQVNRRKKIVEKAISLQDRFLMRVWLDSELFFDADQNILKTLCSAIVRGDISGGIEYLLSRLQREWEYGTFGPVFANYAVKTVLDLSEPMTSSIPEELFQIIDYEEFLTKVVSHPQVEKGFKTRLGKLMPLIKGQRAIYQKRSLKKKKQWSPEAPGKTRIGVRQIKTKPLPAAVIPSPRGVKVPKIEKGRTREEAIAAAEQIKIKLVLEQDFAGIVQDTNGLLKDLAENGRYILPNGLIQDEFKKLKNEKDMILDDAFVNKRTQVYSIMREIIGGKRSLANIVIDADKAMDKGAKSVPESLGFLNDWSLPLNKHIEYMEFALDIATNKTLKVLLRYNLAVFNLYLGNVDIAEQYLIKAKNNVGNKSALILKINGLQLFLLVSRDYAIDYEKHIRLTGAVSESIKICSAHNDITAYNLMLSYFNICHYFTGYYKLIRKRKSITAISGETVTRKGRIFQGKKTEYQTEDPFFLYLINDALNAIAMAGEENADERKKSLQQKLVTIEGRLALVSSDNFLEIPMTQSLWLACIFINIALAEINNAELKYKNAFTYADTILDKKASFENAIEKPFVRLLIHRLSILKIEALIGLKKFDEAAVQCYSLIGEIAGVTSDTKEIGILKEVREKEELSKSQVIRTAEVLIQLGSINVAQDKLDEALEVLDVAYQMMDKGLNQKPASYFDLVNTYKLLDAAYKRKTSSGKPECLERYVELTETFLNDAKTIYLRPHESLHMELAEIKNKQGKQDEALKHWKAADGFGHEWGREELVPDELIVSYMKQQNNAEQNIERILKHLIHNLTIDFNYAQMGLTAILILPDESNKVKVTILNALLDNEDGNNNKLVEQAVERCSGAISEAETGKVKAATLLDKVKSDKSKMNAAKIKISLGIQDSIEDIMARVETKFKRLCHITKQKKGAKKARRSSLVSDVVVDVRTLIASSDHFKLRLFIVKRLGIPQATSGIEAYNVVTAIKAVFDNALEVTSGSKEVEVPAQESIQLVPEDERHERIVEPSVPEMEITPAALSAVPIEFQDVPRVFEEGKVKVYYRPDPETVRSIVKERVTHESQIPLFLKKIGKNPVLVVTGKEGAHLSVDVGNNEKIVLNDITVLTAQIWQKFHKILRGTAAVTGISRFGAKEGYDKKNRDLILHNMIEVFLNGELIQDSVWSDKFYIFYRQPNWERFRIIDFKSGFANFADEKKSSDYELLKFGARESVYFTRMEVLRDVLVGREHPDELQSVAGLLVQKSVSSNIKRIAHILSDPSMADYVYVFLKSSEKHRNSFCIYNEEGDGELILVDIYCKLGSAKAERYVNVYYHIDDVHRKTQRWDETMEEYNIPVPVEIFLAQSTKNEEKTRHYLIEEGGALSKWIILKLKSEEIGFSEEDIRDLYYDRPGDCYYIEYLLYSLLASDEWNDSFGDLDEEEQWTFCRKFIANNADISGNNIEQKLKDQLGKIKKEKEWELHQIGKQTTVDAKSLRFSNGNQDKGTVDVYNRGGHGYQIGQPLGTLSFSRKNANPIEAVKNGIIKGIKQTNNHKDLINKILNLFTSAPGFYTFEDNPLFKDLSGFVLHEHSLIVLHEKLQGNPVALFHELGHLLIDRNDMDLTLEGNSLIVSDVGRNKSVALHISPETQKFIEKEQETWSKDWQQDFHYLLRVLTREIFGDWDAKLTKDIRSGNGKKIIDVEPMPFEMEVISSKERLSELIEEQYAVDDERVKNIGSASNAVLSEVRYPGSKNIILMPKPKTEDVHFRTIMERWTDVKKILNDEYGMGDVLIRFYDAVDMDAKLAATEEELRGKPGAFSLIYAKNNEQNRGLARKINLSKNMRCVLEEIDDDEYSLLMVSPRVALARGLIDFARNDWQADDPKKEILINGIAELVLLLTGNEEIVQEFKVNPNLLFGGKVLRIKPYSKVLEENIIADEAVAKSL